MTRSHTWKDIISCTLPSPTDSINFCKIHTWLSLIGIAAAMLLLGACSNSIGDTGIEVLPPTELVEIIHADTFSVELTTQIVDSISTADSSFQLFGNYIDPEFGRISATSFLQFFPPDSSLLEDADPNNLILDSLVLQLDMTNSYGRQSAPQRINVYELNEDFPIREELSSRSSLAHKGPELTGRREFSYPDLLFDLRVRLSEEFGEKLLFAGKSNLEFIGDFTDYLQGLVVSTEPVGFVSREPGAIYQIYTGFSNTTRLNLYFKYRASATSAFNDTVVVFPLGEEARRFHQIKRTDTADKLLFREQNPPHTYEFLQAGSLITMTVKLPTLDQFPRGAGINNAELFLKVDESFLGSEGRFDPPDAIQLVYLDAKGNELPDENPAGFIIENPNVADFLQIPYDSGNGGYSIKLTSYIQEVIKGSRENNGFIIKPIREPVQFTAYVKRGVITGINHPISPPKLDITYTIPKE